MDSDFKTNKFATTFDENSSGFGGFDDGFISSFSSKPNDPFESSAQDPFGDKKNVKTVLHDVSISYLKYVYVLRVSSC